MKFLIIAKNNISKDKANVIELQKLLDKKNIKYQVVNYDEVEDFYNNIHNKKYKNTFNILLSFGGDGTILKSARIARKLNIPILGINVGTIGFLTSLSYFSKLDQAIDKIKTKKYKYEDRSMIEVMVKRNDKEIFDAYAVNEATFMTSNLSKIGKYRILIGKGKELFTEMNADGMIVATPTGSTAHSLSAGGPIVEPNVNCLIITPLYPHTINQRSFIINDDKELNVEIINDNQIVDIDGRIHCELKTNDIVTIKKLKKPVKYIVFEHNKFLSNIREKIKAL